jgi:hypothetical protein
MSFDFIFSRCKMIITQPSYVAFLLLPVIFCILCIFVKRRAAIEKRTTYTHPNSNMFFFKWTFVYILLGLSILLQWRIDVLGCFLTIFALLNMWWFIFGGEHIAPMYTFLFEVLTALLMGYYFVVMLFVPKNIIAPYITFPLVIWIVLLSFITCISDWNITTPTKCRLTTRQWFFGYL